jgi:hypothetical protein
MAMLYGALWYFMVLYGALWCVTPQNYLLRLNVIIALRTLLFGYRRREIILLILVIGAAKLYYYLW